MQTFRGTVRGRRIRRASSWTGAALLAVGVLVGSSSIAHADDTSSDASASITAIQNADPSVLTNVDAVATTDQGDTAIDTSADGTSVSVPTDASTGISIASTTGDTTPVTVGLPFASDADDAEVAQPGVVTFDNGNGSTTVPVVKDDGSVQINTVIDSASAPSRYVYPVSVPAGGQLSLDKNGAVAVLDSDGSYVAGFDAPWAKDATGAAVPTHYEIDGNDLVQIVDLTDSSIAFPVVADPWFGIGLIDHVNWVTYSKWSPTLAITPTWYGRYGPAGAGWAAWDEVVKKGGSKANTDTMNTQFFCHWDAVRIYEPNKTTWDLDSKRPNTSLLNEINYGCNYPDGGKHV